MTEWLTREQVEDFHARERGYRSAHDERLEQAEFKVGVQELAVERAEEDVAEARGRLKVARAEVRRLKKDSK